MVCQAQSYTVISLNRLLELKLCITSFLSDMISYPIHNQAGSPFILFAITLQISLACMCARPCVFSLCAHTQGNQRTCLGHVPQELPTFCPLFLSQGFSLAGKSLGTEGQLTAETQGSACLRLHRIGIASTHQHIWLS